MEGTYKKVSDNLYLLQNCSPSAQCIFIVETYKCTERYSDGLLHPYSNRKNILSYKKYFIDRKGKLFYQ
jgi:hypothetical protein